MARTIKELAQEALNVQHASNLSGVVHGWSRSITELRELLHNPGTDEINHHPINKLWASKVHDMTGMGLSDMEAFNKAYDVVDKLANS
jgi:hypothetical protein